MNITIALAGNPNCGKTTIFNDLTGSNQYVGNWPGVTVEKKEGTLKGKDNKNIILTDLPGIYSLSPYTPEEIVSRNYLLSDQPNTILNLVDATNLERNLYLTTQLLEIGLPTVIALNMMDVIAKNGDIIDVTKLSTMLGCPIVETTALKGIGSKEAVQEVIETYKSKIHPQPQYHFSETVEKALEEIKKLLHKKVPTEHAHWYAIKCFESDPDVLENLKLSTEETTKLQNIISTVETELDDDGESIITNERYEAITGIIQKCQKKKKTGLTTSDKIDRIVTNRWLALPIFAAIMSVVYILSIYTLGGFLNTWVSDVFITEWVQGGAVGFLESINTAPWLVSLIGDGIIAGVGAVIGFLPQIIIFFIFLSFLEDCGYMARVAFIMDRIFRKFGLSGKSFIPMLISSGCGVPGVMATKTIENEKDRRMTIMTTTFIPCSAKLPIIALVAGALFQGAWWVAPASYFIGIISVVISGIILKKTKLFAGDPAPFVMELPQYHLPAAKNMFMHVWDRAKAFITKAGTIIFAASIIIWFLLNLGFSSNGFGFIEDINDSILAKIGSVIAPIFAPLGFGTWQAAVATISGLVAKEGVVSTLSILMGLSEDAFESDLLNLETMFAGFFATGTAAFSFLVFNLLCAPCFAAIGAIRRSMENPKWTWLAIGYQTIFAYVMSLMIYQFSHLLMGNPFSIGTAVAIILLIFMLFLLFRPNSNDKRLHTSKKSFSKA